LEDGAVKKMGKKNERGGVGGLFEAYASYKEGALHRRITARKPLSHVTDLG
jgi:hypothetical protein